ncbi:MAG: flippase [Candidatus Aenigmarchaeota archaeon]|nr:flippase [Candidatus Aenigmarchaeota archaeon]
MNVIQRIVKNTSSLFIAQIVVSITSIIFSIFLARKLGDVEFGKYSFALAFVAFYGIFLDLGYDTLLIRDVARNKSHASRYLYNILGFRALSSLFIFIFIVITINLMGYPLDTKNAVYLFGIYTIVTALSAVFKITFRAFERMEYEAGITIVSNTIRVLLGLLVLLLGFGLIEVAFAFIFSSVFEIFISFYFCQKKFVKEKSKLEIKFLKSTIKTALPLGMLSIFAIIYVRTDTILLSVMKGDAVVGWYNAAYSLVMGFKPIPHLFMNALLPLMSYYSVSSIDLLKVVYEKAFKYLLLLGLPLSMGMFLLADKIILVFYGQEYSNAIIALQILAWDSVLLFLYGCVAFILVSIDKQNHMAIIAGLAALINVVLNLILIPSFSYVGSAFATILAETFLLVSYFYIASRHFHKLSIYKVAAKPLAACIGMTLCIYLLHDLNLFILIALGIFIYFGIFILLKGFSKEDIDSFKRLIRYEKNKN